MEKRIGRFNRSWKSEPSATREEMTREDAIREEKPGRQNSVPCLMRGPNANEYTIFVRPDPSTCTNPAQWHKGGIFLLLILYLPLVVQVWLGHSCPKPLTLGFDLDLALPVEPIFLSSPSFPSFFLISLIRLPIYFPQNVPFYLSFVL